MSTFLGQRIRDIQGWLPPTDVDGLEVHRNKLFVEQSENMVYENGFWRNNKKPAVISYPANVATDVAGDWTVFSLYYIYHSTRGNVWFYILNSTTNELKFYVQDSDNPDGLVIDIFDGNVTLPDELPTEINYFIVDDQLKINMNTTFDYVNDETTAIYTNLTLVYLDAVGGFGVFPDRVEGWYLTPRWLGWSYFDDRVQFQDTSPSNIVITKDNYTSYFNSGVSVNGINMEFAVGGYVGISGMKAIGGVIIDQAVGSADDNLNILVQQGAVMDGSADTYLFDSYEPNTTPGGDYENKWQALFGVNAVGAVQNSSGSTGVILVLSITFQALSTETLVLARAQDQQVMPIRYYLTGKFPIVDWQFLEIPIVDWDFRIDPDNIEVYIDSGSGILDKYDIAPLNIDAGVAGYMDIELRVSMTYKDHPLVVSPTTLNFTYGLGADIRPFHETYSDDLAPELDFRGDLIYQEVTFRGREYYVRDNFRIYLSHIAGNGLLQPDSYPYDLDAQFGFIKTEYEFEIMRGLAVTPLEELLVISVANNYVYTLQLGQNIIYRRIKAMNGSSGIGSRKSLLRDQRGTVVTSILAWIDKNGAYAYGGGTQEPVELSAPIEHYWLDNVNADNVISVFNPELKEILFANESEILVYELKTNIWNRYVFASPIKEFVGVINNQSYFLADNGILYKITENTTEEFLGSFTTHIDSGYSIAPDGNPTPLNELSDKILQEIYVSTRSSKGGAVRITIIADGNIIDSPITYSSVQEVQNSWAPLLVRYHHVQIKFEILTAGIEIKETGYTFSIPSQSPGGLPFRSPTGFGYDAGKDWGL